MKERDYAFSAVILGESGALSSVISNFEPSRGLFVQQSFGDKETWAVNELSAEYENFYYANYLAAMNYVRLKLFDYGDPEGLVSEAFILLWEKALLTGKLCGRGWFFKVLRNKIGDAIRSVKVRKDREAFVDLSLLPNAELAVTSEMAAVNEAMKKLAEKFREVLVLVYWYDLSATEAATSLGLNEVAFRKRLSRARAEFKRVYGHIPTSPCRTIGRQSKQHHLHVGHCNRAVTPCPNVDELELEEHSYG